MFIRRWTNCRELQGFVSSAQIGKMRILNQDSITESCSRYINVGNSKKKASKEGNNSSLKLRCNSVLVQVGT